MEVQITDFENAAFASFIVLLSRAIIEMRLQFYIPMSKLEENMKTAQQKQACTEAKFWFRTKVIPCQDMDPAEGSELGDEPYALMTVNEILIGQESYLGLIPLCRQYLDHSDCKAATRDLLTEYLAFIEKRAAGSILTTAKWMRNFVLSHEAYRGDCRVPPAAAYDLMVASAEIGNGRRECPELLG